LQNRVTAIHTDLAAITQAIAERVPVEEIYLFGSYAYGTPGEDSG
jgi:predicted nucleotidyltransferase